MNYTVDQSTFSVEDRGAGDPLLFVHGFPLNSSMWQAQLEFFESRYRVIAPDLRGFGSSKGAASLVTMQDYADDLAELLKEMKILEPVTFCGLSMGGYIAWQFAERHPHQMKRLILCDTKATADPEAARLQRLELADRVEREGSEFFVDTMLKKIFAPATFASQPELVDSFRKLILNTDPQAIAGASRGMAERPDFTERVGGITVPTLLLCGSDDTLTPPDQMEQLAGMMYKAEFHLIPGAGHMAPVENPQAVNEVIARFLAATDV
ncbi:alpha/beta fold hydrolase [Rubinisphaera margarita]|uniref:alpha/beta fold hydrolase n=1 Tax=Rubinisphaera margarita TaxID=2909586 RepID=UPI001EE92776|nr:alpha/beta fold hydrolase [Rubinisphaera margarita]MCG6155519.1 alpha/beta hydrolase [Rubinisphaera margarita]